MRFLRRSVAAAIAVLALGCAGTANAGVISGRIWTNDPTGAQNATPGNVPNTTPNVTFDVDATGLKFDSRLVGNGYTIGGFLTSGGGAFNAYNIAYNGATSGGTINNTIWEFTGNVTMKHGQVFHVEHDDGLTLTIGGDVVVNQPGPTAPTDTSYTWNGADGTFAFQLVYGECFGAPAVLETDLPLVNSAPEPSSMALLGFGVLGLGGYAWRRKKLLKKVA
jgi:hypothetical protein